jgi:fibronectin type 3 domain-containing protein
VAISPTLASIPVSTQKQFAATVSGTTNTGVSWSATGGTVSSSGLYTAGAMAGTYSVKATSVADTTKSASATVTVTAVITSSHTVNLSWIASTSANIAGYNLYRSLDQASWSKINSGLIASTLYTDTPVDHQTYYYEATAVDINNVESADSNVATAVVP